MIPYDDLVVALSAWRVRKGLPGTPGASGAVGSAAAPRPVAVQPSGPRTAPPGAPPPARAPAVVVAHDTSDDSLDVDDAALLDDEAHDTGEPAGNYAMAFEHEPGEATAIGVPPPPRASEGGINTGDDASDAPGAANKPRW